MADGNGRRFKAIDDAEWLDVQLEPERARREFGVDLPGLPTDDQQITFTGRAGALNMQQAFNFYRYARAAAGLASVENPMIMDFGAGWGRIARLWLRDTIPENIVTADTMNFAIECLQATGAPYTIVQNPAHPPIPGFSHKFHLIYAYSVFSHLSERYFRAWTDYLLDHLHPGGSLVFTTRGEQFIQNVANLKGMTEAEIDQHTAPGVAAYIRRHREVIGDLDEVRAKHEAGEFQYFLVGDEGNHNDDCSGEAMIPKGYVKSAYPDEFVSYEEHIPEIDQAVIVLRKTDHNVIYRLRK